MCIEFVNNAKLVGSRKALHKKTHVYYDVAIFEDPLHGTIEILFPNEWEPKGFNVDFGKYYDCGWSHDERGNMFTCKPSHPIVPEPKKQYVSNDQFWDEVFAGKRNDYMPTDTSILKAGVRAESKRMLQAGKLHRRYKCELCGDATSPLHMHHRSYNKADSWADIIWLCPECHKIVHKNRKVS